MWLILAVVALVALVMAAAWLFRRRVRRQFVEFLRDAYPQFEIVGQSNAKLDLKHADGMRLMKKDMGGAANALGLAQMIMALRLPVRLQLLIPAVENAIAGNAFRPGDVFKTRQGLHI